MKIVALLLKEGAQFEARDNEIKQIIEIIFDDEPLLVYLLLAHAIAKKGLPMLSKAVEKMQRQVLILDEKNEMHKRCLGLLTGVQPLINILSVFKEKKSWLSLLPNELQQGIIALILFNLMQKRS